ncbi:MAG: hypothetical protein ACE14V_13915 [bacterium]
MTNLTPIQAIVQKCTDCCGNNLKEVKLCTAIECSLYQYRLGKNPNRKGIGGNPKIINQKTQL